jgi:alcohol dehydrogenase (cytochrome c)
MKRWLLLAALVPAAFAQVSYERIRRAEREPGSWLTYSGNYLGHRFSPLDQITPANVARLRPAWLYQGREAGKLEATPLVADGILYLTERQGAAVALDIRSGRPIWTHRRPTPGDLRACCGSANRGFAMLDDSLFMGTLDSRLVALDARTGKQRWEVTIADYRQGYAITVAPLAVKDKVIVGVAGGEYGIRGFLDAYDARTGARVWRFWTVPAPGEPGGETWSGDSWKTGGASTWVTGSYDPDLNLLFWGTGNAGPDYNGDRRAGDNLYAASIVALDADTGRLRWHFQFTPHDEHDWDSTHVPVLIDGTVGGRKRKLLVEANRNAFYYVLDRETGEFLAGVQYGKQTWAKGLDGKGRPVRLPDTFPTPAGNVVYPGMHGATNWFSPSYSPRSGLYYVAVREEGTTYYRGNPTYRAGEWFTAGGTTGIPGVEPSGSIRALESLTGKLRWEFALQSPPWSGLLSTAGGVVFGGCSEGYLFALDAEKGTPLWRFQTGGPIFGNPISFLVDGKQHLATTAGPSLVVFALE